MIALTASISIAYAQDGVDAARGFLENGQPDRALAAAEQWIASHPTDAEARFVRAVALAELGRRAEAIASFSKLTEDLPNQPEPYNNLAVLYAQQRDYDAARKALEQAIRTHPSYATAHANLTDLYARLANEAYERALQLDAGREAKRPPASQPPLALIRTLGPAAPAPLVVAQQMPVVVPSSPPAAAPRPGPDAVMPAVNAPAQPAPRASADSAGPQPSAKPAPAETLTEPPSAPPVTPPAPAAPSSTATEEVLTAVRAWADAWSAKDVTAYLAAYDKTFEVHGGRTRAAWEQERRQRVSKPGEIRVTVEDPQVEIDGDRAQVRFRQHYRSLNFNASTNKVLELVRRGQRWHITQEKVVR